MGQKRIVALFLLIFVALALSACDLAASTEQTPNETPVSVALPTPQSPPTAAPGGPSPQGKAPAVDGPRPKSPPQAAAQARPSTSAADAAGQPPLSTTPSSAPLATPGPSTPVPQNTPLGLAFGEGSDNLNHFMDYIHDLGLHRTKVSFYWLDLEPEPDQFDLHKLDAYLDQLGPEDQALLNLFTNGWCTYDEEVGSRKGAPLRQCPKGEENCTKSCDEYYREFVIKVAEEVRDRSHGGIRYMQRDTEPASGRHFPADEPEAYVHLQHIFYEAVKSVLPDMWVIGVNHNGNFQAHGMGEPLSADFFDYVLQHSQDDFDLLDIRLYEDIYAIPHRVAWFRSRMAQYGYQKPIVSTEYGGVDPRTFHDGDEYLFRAQLRKIEPYCQDVPPLERPRCVRRWAKAHPDQIHPKLRPFYGVASEEEQATYERLHCYDMVQRSVMALSQDVQALWWWNLQSPGTDLIFGQMRLRTPEMEELPGYGCFRRFVQMMGDVTAVQRIDLDDAETYFFQVRKADGSTMFVAWHRPGNLDPYDAAAAAAATVSLPVPFASAKVTNALGEEQSMDVSGEELTIDLSAVPIFIEEEARVAIPRPVVTPRPLPSPTPTAAPTVSGEIDQD